MTKDENGARIESIVLMNAWEDHAMLWQILDEISSAVPSLPKEAALDTTRRVIRSMIQRGLIEIYRRENRLSEFTILNGPKREAALNADPFWRADERDTVEISVAVTKAGETAYLTQRSESKG